MFTNSTGRKEDALPHWHYLFCLLIVIILATTDAQTLHCRGTKVIHFSCFICRILKVAGSHLKFELLKTVKTSFWCIPRGICVLRNPVKLSLNHYNINWKDRITEVLWNGSLTAPALAVLWKMWQPGWNHRFDQSSILCHGLCEFSICFFRQKSMKPLQKFNFILEWIQKAKRYITTIRKFSSFWFWDVFYYYFSEETTSSETNC